MVNEALEQLPTTHFLVSRNVIRADGSTWKGLTTIEIYPADLNISWRPGYTDIEISNYFVKEEWQIRELTSRMITLKQAAASRRRLVTLNGINFDSLIIHPLAINLYLIDDRKQWIEPPAHVALFPQRLVADIDRKTTADWLPKQITVDQAVEAFLKVRRLIELAIPQMGSK